MANAETKTLAFEIGTEEIPAFDLQKATKQLAELMPSVLDDNKIEHGEVSVFTTPRRLIAIVKEVACSTVAVEEEHKGPSVKIAFDEAGNPTKAALGFARGKGVEASELVVKEEKGTEYVFAYKSIPAIPTTELLPDILRGVIDALSWPKSMKWNTYKELFSRPVRWIVALLGSDVIKFSYAGIESSNETYGHRVLASGPFSIDTADNLVDVVRNAYVIPSEGERKRVIEQGVADIEKANPGCVATLPEKTLTEVINLSEYPTVLMGQFDQAFLKVPEEIIVDAMLMHQRYFPLYKEGMLTNKFIVVSNGDPKCSDIIIDGNERVVAARLYDAKFFYEEDLKTPLEAYVDRLDEVVFQEQLGTMRDKTARVEQLAERMCLDADLAAAEKGEVARAAKLAKADLVTNAVVEFTSVQGIMGSYYAKASGETGRVACAIAEHYRPRFAGDNPPSDIVGKVVAAADKLDTICGLFALGQAPTGSSDPFALRRSALGIIAIMQDGLSMSLEKMVRASLDIYRESGLDFNVEDVFQSVIDFFVVRTKVLLRDEGNEAGVVDAVLAAGVCEPIEIIERTRALSDAIKNSPEQFEDLATAYARANNLRDTTAGEDADQTLFDEAERTLAEAIDKVQTKVNEALDGGLYPVALTQLAELRKPIDDFFESTMIMDEDLALRANRMKLLNSFVSVFARIADFSLIAHKK